MVNWSLRPALVPVAVSVYPRKPACVIPGVVPDTAVAWDSAVLAPNVKAWLFATPLLMTVILAWSVAAVRSTWPGVLVKPPVMVALEVRLAATAWALVVRSIAVSAVRSEEHTSELQSLRHL